MLRFRTRPPTRRSDALSDTTRPSLTRRELLETLGKAAAATVVAGPLVELTMGEGGVLSARALPLAAVAGVDRVVMTHGKTYLNGWTGYGEPPRRGRQGGRGAATPPPVENPGPVPSTTWRKVSGPGDVTFADPKAAVTTATFSAPGAYVLEVTAESGAERAASTLAVTVEMPPPA